MKRVKYLWIILLISAFAAGCAGIPVREEVKPDLSLPVGKIEGNQFIGIRFPFKLSVPAGWRATTEPPPFMVDLGFEKEGLEDSDIFIYNPNTQSNLQIDFEPAGRYSTFNQGRIEWLTTIATGSLVDEIKEDYGKDVKVEVGPTEPYRLKGVPFAAKKYAAYAVKGVKREQGWVYAFVEPYQIFIIYIALEKGGSDDQKAIQAILESFEVTPMAQK